MPGWQSGWELRSKVGYGEAMATMARSSQSKVDAVRLHGLPGGACSAAVISSVMQGPLGTFLGVHVP